MKKKYLFSFESSFHKELKHLAVESEIPMGELIEKMFYFFKKNYEEELQNKADCK